MSWKNVAEKVASFAPILGGLVAGPAGAAGGKLISDLLGVESEPSEVIKALESPEAKQRLIEFEHENFKLKAELNKTMLESEAKSTHTTRPKIAYQAFQVLACITLLIVSGWLYAVLKQDSELTKSIIDGWPFALAVIGPFVGWLNAYFGVLRKEQADKMNALNGKSITGISDLFRK